MNKAPRYMKEFANDRIRYYKGQELMLDEYKEKAVNAIRQALKCYGWGLLTVSEAMSAIANPLS